MVLELSWRAGAGSTGPALRWLHLLAGVVLGVLVIGPSFSCGSSVATAPPVPAENVKQSLRQAVAAVLNLESAAFTLEHRKGTTVLLSGFLEMHKVYGVVEIPDKFQLTVEGQLTLPVTFVELKVVVIGDQAYITDPRTGKWNKAAPEVVPVSFTDLGRTLAEIIEAVDSPGYVGMERVRGREADRIKGTVQSGDLSALVPGAGQEFDVELELWVDRADSLLLQVLITGQVVPSDIPDAVRILTLDDINVPVDITAPE